MDDLQISRIVLESEGGWNRIKGNVDQALGSAMEMRLASLPGGKDGEMSRRVRKEVEVRISKIREDMWEKTTHNLRINGHDYEDFIQATEPFDEVLDRNIWSMYAERVAWEVEVSGQRKDRPRQLRKVEIDMEKRRNYAEWLPNGDEEEEGQTKKAADIPKPPRHDETINTFEKVVENLSELASSAQGHLVRAQRAQNVRDEIANLPQ